MRFTIFAACLATASAFVSNSLPKAAVRSSRSSALKMAFEDEPGVVSPLGYWDPLGFSAEGDVEKFNKYRAIEIKHGRVAMLAAAHTLHTHFAVLGGSLGDVPFSKIPVGLGAINAVPTLGWVQILLFCSILEIAAPQKEDRIPGDVQPDSVKPLFFGFVPAFDKLDSKDPEDALAYQNKEINNGRLAMVSVLGAWVGELVGGGPDPVQTLIEKLNI